MAAAGITDSTQNHVAAICQLALDLQAAMLPLNERLGTTFPLRVGIHTGSAVGGVIGTSRFTYDLWGDSVNVASRMESQGRPGSVQVTQAVIDVAPPEFVFEPAGTVDIKGKGSMTVHILVSGTEASVVQTK